MALDGAVRHYTLGGMFIRFQSRHEQKRRAPRHLRHMLADGYVILAECVWVDGKSKQRHVAYLGPVHLKQDVFYRVWFWHRIRGKLDALGSQIPSEERRKIEASLAEHVPDDVTPKMVAAYDIAYQRRMRAQFGEFPGVYLDWPPGQAGVPPRTSASLEKVAS
jgi:hypothetical protein